MVHEDGHVNEFKYVQEQKKDSYVTSCLTKWDIARGLQLHQFRYSHGFHRMSPEEFLRDLFSSPSVGAILQRVDDCYLRHHLGGAVNAVECEHVRATVTSMGFFDRLESCDPPVVRTGGRLVQCMDDICDGITVSDELRKMMVSEESEHVDLFSAEEKSELLYRLLSLVAVGGPMTQFEDTLAPYTEVSKRLYKSLVSVRKNASTHAIEVASSVYRVKSVSAEDGWSLFPRKKPNRQDVCFVCVDPARYLVTVMYHVAQPTW